MPSVSDQQGFPTHSPLRASQLYRDIISREAREGGNNCQLWATMWNSIFNTCVRFTRSNNPTEEFEIDLHDLWFVLIQAGMYIDHDHSEQDRIVTQVLSAKEMGTLVRRGPSMEVIEEAIILNARIWNDLPFLTSDLTDHWIQQHASMSTKERTNLAALMAKLSATGAGGDSLCACALVVLRDALETSRPLVRESLTSAHSQMVESGDNSPSLQILSIADLLPAANMWLLNGDAKILQLSDSRRRGFRADFEKLGDLMKSDSGTTIQPGFNPQRWKYWLKRLEEIRTLHESVQGVSELAGRIMTTMVASVESFDTPMKRDLSHEE